MKEDKNHEFHVLFGELRGIGPAGASVWIEVG